MWPTIILVLCLMVATAVIAYWSDNLGKKLGKKRVTLFGLRPKQTATLITIGSSMPIMLFTLGATLLAYKPLRDSLTKYEATRRDRDLLSQQLPLLQSDVKLAQRDKEQALEERGKAQNERAKALDERRAALAQKQQVLTELNKARESVKAERQKAQLASRAAEEARRDVKRAGREAADARNRARAARAAEVAAKKSEDLAHQRERDAVSSAKRAQSRLSKANAALGAVNAKLAQVNARLGKTQKQLAQAQADVARVTKELYVVAKERDRVAQQNATQGAILAENGRKILTQEQQILAQEQQILAQEAQVAKAQQAAVTANNQLKAARDLLYEAQTSEIFIGSGETLAEKVIAPGQSQAKTEAQISELIESAKVYVRRPIEDKRNRNMALEIPALPYTTADGASIELSRDKQVELLAQDLASADAPSSVRVLASRSYLDSEPKVEARLVAIQVRETRFKKGGSIVSANIDGRDSDGRIFKQLRDLADDGARAATREGVNPPLSKEVLFYAPNTNERIFEALRDIKAFKAMTRVTIVAAEDVLTTSPLRVRFDVEPAASSANSSGGPSA